MNFNEKIIAEIASLLHDKVLAEDFVFARGHKTVELLNKPLVFNCEGDGLIQLPGFSTSSKYIEAEKAWYNSMNPSNVDIKDFAQIWASCADFRGMTNSNYGYLIFSPQNGYQFDNVAKALVEDNSTRQAIMYYTNPNMHTLGGNDHICTLNVAYHIRKGLLHATVSMRSNDLRFGLVGADLNWQIHVLKLLHSYLLEEGLNVELGNVYWHAMSLHVYERHFSNIKELADLGI